MYFRIAMEREGNKKKIIWHLKGLMLLFVSKCFKHFMSTCWRKAEFYALIRHYAHPLYKNVVEPNKDLALCPWSLFFFSPVINDVTRCLMPGFCSVSNLWPTLRFNSLKASRKLTEEILCEPLRANDYGIKCMIHLPLKAMKVLSWTTNEARSGYCNRFTSTS